MTYAGALASFRARWGPERPDADDVRERVAIRFEHDEAEAARWRVVAGRGYVRLFRWVRDGRQPVWRSAYVHSLRDVDGVIDRIGGMA